jgi:predicted esterase YcpF (UPF0227 family)
MTSSRPRALIYIHGFGSSSASWKAQLLREYFAEHLPDHEILTPDLPVEPRRAMRLLDDLVAEHAPLALVGSSLGGFYATALAARHDVRAALINPVVRPWRLLADYVGEHNNYHSGDPEYFDPAWVGQLEALAAVPGSPEKLLVLMQTGDETLDWQQAWQFYRDCHLFRGLGGSHGFDDFDAFIPLILRFCGITTGTHD